MNLTKRVEAFVKLGEFLSRFNYKEDYSKADNNTDIILYSRLQELIVSSFNANKWFTKENVVYAIESIASNLNEVDIYRWLNKYSIQDVCKDKMVGVIIAGNIPIVGFHDFVCVLLSGNKFLGKLSSKDKYLLPFLADALINIEPSFNERIAFTEEIITDFDAVIATGSDNTSRYFEYYFNKYPHIIRKNRKSVAVLTGNESKEDLEKLAIDIFQYFGLGCRNVSKLYVPEGFDLNLLFDAFLCFGDIIQHTKHMNNYDYNKVLFLMNNVKFKDNGFIMLKEDTSLASPISTLNYEYYKNISEVIDALKNVKDKLQCIVSDCKEIENSIPFGTSQIPSLNDYADDVDTMIFLLSL